jgi:hypothetical protein
MKHATGHDHSIAEKAFSHLDVLKGDTVITG